MQRGSPAHLELKLSGLNCPSTGSLGRAFVRQYEPRATRHVAASTASGGNWRARKKKLVEVLSLEASFNCFQHHPCMFIPGQSVLALPSNQDCSEHNPVWSFIHRVMISLPGLHDRTKGRTPGLEAPQLVWDEAGEPAEGEGRGSPSSEGKTWAAVPGAHYQPSPRPWGHRWLRHPD